jgi:hypothetical protein
LRAVWIVLDEAKAIQRTIASCRLNWQSAVAIKLSHAWSYCLCRHSSTVQALEIIDEREITADRVDPGDI